MVLQQSSIGFTDPRGMKLRPTLSAANLAIRQPRAAGADILKAFDHSQRPFR